MGDKKLSALTRERRTRPIGHLETNTTPLNGTEWKPSESGQLSTQSGVRANLARENGRMGEEDLDEDELCSISVSRWDLKQETSEII